MKSIWFAALLPALLLAREARALTAEEILERIDRNMGSDRKISVATMEIRGARGSRTVRSKSWIEGMHRSFTEYLAPAREQGTKMLKLEDQLWIFSPSTDRTILISGHMLRQSVMGSDLSYEDLMEDPKLTNLYAAEIDGDEPVGDRPCHVLKLTAKSPEIAYASRRVWVDAERFVILREERYAKSGRLLKTTEVLATRREGARWVPETVVFRDALRDAEGTVFTIETIEFDAAIPDHLFTKAALRR